MENKYKKGDVVAERIRPALKLVIRGYMDRIYYVTLTPKAEITNGYEARQTNLYWRS